MTIGAGANGKPQPNPSPTRPPVKARPRWRFYNVLQGDAPYLKSSGRQLCHERQLSPGCDGRHRSQPHHDGNWRRHLVQRRPGPSAAAAAQPTGRDRLEEPRHRRRNRESQLRSPAPTTGTPKTATAAVRTDRPSVRRWVATATAPTPTRLASSRCSTTLRPCPTRLIRNALPGRWYFLNNYNPGYFGDGSNAYTDNNDNNTVFTIPPSNVRNIGDELLANNISWKYYGDQWNRYLARQVLPEPAE